MARGDFAADLTGFIVRSDASSAMTKTKPATKTPAKSAATKTKIPAKPAAPKTKSSRTLLQQELVTGQLWRVADMNLRVGLIGKILVHYKLAKPNAVRIPNSVSGKTTVEDYLKKNKAVLIEG